VKDAGREHSVCLSFPEDIDKMLQGSRAAARDYRDMHGGTHSGCKLQVISVLGSIRVHAGKQDLSGTISLSLLGPENRVQFGLFSAPVRVNTPFSRRRAPGINRDHDALDPERFSSRTDQGWLQNCRSVDAHFICSRQQQVPDIANAPNATAHRYRHKTLVCRPFNDIDHRPPSVGRRGNIEKDKLISPLPIVFHRALHGITSIAELNELGAFHNPAVGDIKARDDPLGEHET
jgi:hypothetical protein